MITTLIDKLDSVEIIRDRIAEILVTEARNQQLLARAAGKDHHNWALRVFVDRMNPWGDFIDADEESQRYACPIVNVSFASASYDARKGDVVMKQQASGAYNIDVYGCGISGDRGGGHVAGDAKARSEALRGARLVRNILMSGSNIYLGLRGVVGRRWPQQLEIFDIDAESISTVHVVAARLRLDVDFIETSPQVEGEILEGMTIAVKRKETNEAYLTAEYGEEPA